MESSKTFTYKRSANIAIVKKNVLDPLGMDRTDWYFEKDKLSRFVKPYDLVAGKLMPGSTKYAEAAVADQQGQGPGDDELLPAADRRFKEESLVISAQHQHEARCAGR